MTLLMWAPLNVLVIDDCVMVGESFALLLGVLGHSVATVSTGQQGLEWLNHSSADLVVLDLNLGAGLDGFEVARTIRATTHIRQPYIVALTGHDIAMYQEQARSCGCNELVFKPMDGATLDGVLERVMIGEQRNGVRR